jgi:hypothetical protein
MVCRELRSISEKAKVRKTFHECSRIFHPDKFKLPEATENFVIINSCYEDAIERIGLEAEREAQKAEREAQKNKEQFRGKEKEQPKTEPNQDVNYRFYINLFGLGLVYPSLRFVKKK